MTPCIHTIYRRTTKNSCFARTSRYGLLSQFDVSSACAQLPKCFVAQDRGEIACRAAICYLKGVADAENGRIRGPKTCKALPNMFTFSMLADPFFSGSDDSSLFSHKNIILKLSLLEMGSAWISRRCFQPVTFLSFWAQPLDTAVLFCGSRRGSRLPAKHIPFI